MQVLLVEDDDALAHMVERRLSAVETLYSLDIVRRNSLHAALEFLKVAKPDVVLLDLGLPDSKGLDTVHALFEHAAVEVPVVIMSAIDEREVVTDALRAGASDFIVKGKLDPLTLVEILRNAVERHAREMVERRKREKSIEEQITLLNNLQADHDPIASLEVVRVVTRNLRKLVAEDVEEPST